MYIAKKLWKSLFTVVMCAAVIMNIADFSAVSAFEPDVKVHSDGVFMVNLDTDIVVYQKNATKKLYPASTTKIMTCIIAMELIDDWNEFVKITYDATNEFWEGDPNKEGPSNAALEAGQDNITYKDCIYGLMVSSACEAANILAINTCGNIENFVAKMNEKAAQLGCVNTHFGNTHGLWQEDNYSCAYDMYLIAKYAYDTIPNLLEICDTYQYEFPPNEFNPDGYIKTATNALIINSAENPFYYEYAHGIKTGSIDYYWDEEGNVHEGGRCLVSMAKKGGYTYMISSLQAPYFDENGEKYNYSALDHVNLYDWAFSTFNYETVISENDVVAEMKVVQGEGKDHVSLRPAASFATLLPDYLNKSAIQRILNVDSSVVAPVEEGQVLGSLELRLDGETMAKLDLVATEAISRSQIEYIKEQVGNVTGTAWFKILLVLLIVLIIVLIVLLHIRKRRRQAQARKRARKNKSVYR